MDIKNFLHFARTAGKLKRIKRSGWKVYKIKQSESVADHSFGVVVLALVIAPLLDVNQEKIIKMAIIHDLAEAKIGDIITEVKGKINISARLEKEKLELVEINRIFKDIISGKDYIDLFKEMIEGKTKEAKILKQLDKLELALQAYEYEEEQGIDLSEFFDGAYNNMSEPKLKEIIKELLKMRKST